MAFALSNTIKSVVGKARRSYTKTSYGVSSQDFNRSAYDEACKLPCTSEDVDSNDDDNDSPEEEWASVRSVNANDGLDDTDYPYAVKEDPGKVRKTAYKFSERTLSAALKAAGVSAEYAMLAMKFVAVEAARDVGWLANCKTAVDAVRSLKARMPLLEDMSRAFETASIQSKEQTRRHSIAYRTYAPDPSVGHPRDIRVPSNLDDIAIISNPQIRNDFALHRGKRIYNPTIHAGLEEVPADPNDIYSNEAHTLDEGEFINVLQPRKKGGQQPSKSVADSEEEVSNSNEAQDKTDELLDATTMSPTIKEKDYSDSDSMLSAMSSLRTTDH